MSEDKLNTQVETPPSIASFSVHAQPGFLARLTIGAWADKPGQESLVQLTNPIAQHIAFYVSAKEKPRFITELRKALDAWERLP